MPLIVNSKSRGRKIDHAANLAWQIIQGHLAPRVEQEWVFHPTRKWRFDLAIVHQAIAIEIEGGLFMTGTGRHNRGAGARADMEKYNEAVLLGWRILRVLPEWVANGKAFGLVERAVKGSR